MQTTARDMVESIRSSITNLALSSEYGTKNAVYRDLAEFSGLSFSLVMKLDQGLNTNLRADTIDALVKAVHKAERKAAA